MQQRNFWISTSDLWTVAEMEVVVYEDSNRFVIFADWSQLQLPYSYKFALMFLVNISCDGYNRDKNAFK